MNPVLLQASERLLTALGNSLTQGLLVGLAVWIGVRALRRTNAATRYAVEFAGLLAVAALPVVHLAIPDAPAPAPAALPTDDPAVVRGIARGIARAPVEFGAYPIPAVDELATRPSAGSAGVAVSAEPDSAAWPSPGADGIADIVPSGGSPEPVAPGSWLGVLGDWRTTEPHPVLLSDWLIAALGLLWSVIALGRLLLLARQLMALRGLKRDAEMPPAAMMEVFEEVQGRLRAGRSVALGICPDVSSPIAAGFVHPMVLLPIGLVDAARSDWDRVLRHELAHLQRRDDWTNLIQQTIRAVLFFHPTVLWLSRRLTLDREIACDDQVISRTGKAREYALFLTELACRKSGREWTAAPAAWSNSNQLKERIHMLLDPQRNASPSLAKAGAGIWITGVAFIAALGLYAAPRIALAGTAAASNSVLAEDPAVSAPGDRVAPAPVPPTPEPAIPPVSAGLMAPPLPPSATLPGVAPAPGPAPAPRQESIESRLERVERLVESLTRGPRAEASSLRPERYGLAKIKPGSAVITHRGAGATSGHGVDSSDLSREIDVRVKTEVDGVVGLEAMNRIMIDVERQVEQATRQAERAAQEAMKAAALPSDVVAQRQDVENRRRALDAERRALQKQIARVEAQLGRLDGHLDRVNGILDHQTAAAEAEREHRRAVVEHEKAIGKVKDKSGDTRPATDDPVK